MKTVWLIEFSVAYEGSTVRYIAHDEAAAIEYAKRVMEEEKPFVRGPFDFLGKTESDGKSCYRWNYSDKNIYATEIEVVRSETETQRDYEVSGPFYNGC